MEREIPPSPSAQEAWEYARRLQEVRNISAGGKKRRSFRREFLGSKGSIAEEEIRAGFSSEAESMSRCKVSEQLWKAAEGSRQEDGREGAACPSQGREATKKASQRPSQADRQHVNRGGRQDSEGARVRPPQRRRWALAQQEEHVKSNKEVMLSVAVSAVTSLVVCLLVSMSSGVFGAFLGKLLGSGWSM